MIQLSDLVIYCVKRFIELENGYRENWSQETKEFYAGCYDIISARSQRTRLVERQGRGMNRLNEFLSDVRAEARVQWRRHYGLSG